MRSIHMNFSPLFVPTHCRQSIQPLSNIKLYATWCKRSVDARISSRNSILVAFTSELTELDRFRWYIRHSFWTLKNKNTQKTILSSWWIHSFNYLCFDKCKLIQFRPHQKNKENPSKKNVVQTIDNSFMNISDLNLPNIWKYDTTHYPLHSTKNGVNGFAFQFHT